MNPKTTKQLEQAKTLFFSGKLVECYHILRRYYDRLPFRVEEEHAEYIGMFIRTISELGKDYELKFYLSELERHWSRMRSPVIAFQMAAINIHVAEPNLSKPIRLLEDILRNDKVKQLHAKAAMSLALAYCRMEKPGLCRPLIFSIEEPSDPRLARLLKIWKANIFRYEKNFKAALELLKEVESEVTFEDDWYSYYSVRQILTHTYLDANDIQEALPLIASLKAIFEARHFKTVQSNLQALEETLREKTTFKELFISQSKNHYTFTYINKVLSLSADKPAEKLLIMLAKKRFLDKESIVKSIYNRNYDGNGDDKLIYAHIHAARKRLKALGLPSNAVSHEGTGYRLIPKVKKLKTME